MVGNEKVVDESEGGGIFMIIVGSCYIQRQQEVKSEDTL